MREMKDSGIEYIGVIPQNWEIIRVKDEYLFDTGFTPDTKHSEYYTDDEGYEWVTISDVVDGVIKHPTKSLISREYVRMTHRTKVPKGSLLYSFKLSIGATAIVDKDIFTNEAIASFFPKSNISLGFLKYSSTLIEFNSNTNIYGANILNQKLINDAHIVFPPLREQDAIAYYLDTKCAEIDALNAEIEKEIDTLEEYKRSVITEAVTKGLNPNAPMKDSGIEWVGEIPEHWEVMHNKYIMEKTKTIIPVYGGEDILSLTMNGVVVRDLDAGGKIPASFNGYQKIVPGNLLMCLFDYDVTPRCIGLIKNEGLTSSAYSQFALKGDNKAEYYYYYYLMIDLTKELLHLAKNLRYSFTEDQLGLINVPVPSPEEQIAIAEYLDDKCAEINTITAQKQKQLAALDDYKKSLIYEYVTGKKEVPDNEC